MALASLHSLPAWQAARLKTQDHQVLDFYCDDRCGHNAICIRDELLVWGGYNERVTGSMYCDTNILWSYNLDLDVWRKLRTGGKIPQYRSGACSALLWPYWYIICGHSYEGDGNDIHRLNLIELQWETVDIVDNSQKISPRDKASAWISGDRIYCFGGYGNIPYNFLWDRQEDTFTVEEDRGWNDQVLYFDTLANLWVKPTCKGSKPKGRAAHATSCIDNHVFLFGGRHQAQRMNDLHCLNLETHTWSGRLACKGSSPEGRSWHTMTKVGQSQLIIYGGFNNENTQLDDAWQLSTETLSWSLLKNSTGFPRLWHTASLNFRGDILIYGGCETNILDDSAVTSSKVILLRTEPFSLERLCLHYLYKNKGKLSNQWNSLPRQFQDWLHKKETLTEELRPGFYQHNVEAGLGPGLSQLALVTKSEAQRLNERMRYSDYLFHAF